MQPRSERRFGPLAMALAGAGGFLAGVLLIAILGGADHFRPPEDITALERVGAHVTTKVYPDAGHGFVHDASRPAHRADDAADAWRWVISFLA